jgi:hypothetical protein
MKALADALKDKGVNLRTNAVFFSRAWSRECQTLFEELPEKFPVAVAKQPPDPRSLVVFFRSEMQCAAFMKLRCTAIYAKAADKTKIFTQSWFQVLSEHQPHSTYQ